MKNNGRFFVRVHFPLYGGMADGLTVYAPPPKWFAGTLAAFDIKFDLDLAKECDTLQTWEPANPRRKSRRPEVEIIPPSLPETSSPHLLT
jgi:hypothetical protein